MNFTFINHQTTANKKKDGKDKPSVVASVINNEMIRAAVKKYNQENKILMQDDKPFNQVKVLSLSFHNIMHINNLQGLDSLERLQLDNNLIAKMENIEMLVNIRWLDLSFNVITEITGLDTLRKLEDLSLYSNKITKLQGLDNCTKLNVLSIGRNELKEMDHTIDYLRKFRFLNVVNIAKNPFTEKDQEYKPKMIVMLSALKYLDYQFIDEEQRKKLKDDDKYKDALEDKKELSEEQEKERLLRIEKLKRAKVDVLETLPEELTHDAELERMKTLFPGVDEEIITFISKMREHFVNLQEEVVKINEQRLKLIQNFMDELQSLEKESEGKNQELLHDFNKLMKQIVRKHEQIRAHEEMVESKKLMEKEDFEKLVEQNKEEELKDFNILQDKLREMEDALLVIEMDYNSLKENSINNVDSKFKIQLDEYQQMMVKVVTDEENLNINDQNIANFTNQVQDIVKNEVERIDAENAGKDDFDDDYYEYRNELPTIIENVRNHVKELAFKKFGDIAAAIREDNTNLKNKLQLRLYESNRQNVQNIKKLVADLYNKILKELDLDLEDM